MLLNLLPTSLLVRVPVSLVVKLHFGRSCHSRRQLDGRHLHGLQLLEHRCQHPEQRPVQAAATVAYNAEVDELNHKAIIDAATATCPASSLPTAPSPPVVLSRMSLQAPDHEPA
ncbi:hypothetical protein Ptr902_14051, partial [Pyrenophora tritici-repentis]